MHGYSSSSEDSDNDYRRNRHQPPPPANDKTKVKKKKLPPQITINRVWKRFSKKQFSKALAVLPFDPVPPPIVSERANELLSAGYERAAEECRRKVRKIIQECRRVNMRYRDPGFDLVSLFCVPVLCCGVSVRACFRDTTPSRSFRPEIGGAAQRVRWISEDPLTFRCAGCDLTHLRLERLWTDDGVSNPQDWDLKMEKGHCLNSLGRTKFDLSATTNPDATVPKAVKRVHEIFEQPKFMDKVSGSDVKQGSLGDCWLIATFSGLANVEDGIKRICVEYDTKIGIYGFVFFRGKSGRPPMTNPVTRLLALQCS